MKLIVNANEVSVDDFCCKDRSISLTIDGKIFQFSTQEIDHALVAVAPDNKAGHIIVAGKDYFIQDFSCQNSGQAEVGAMTSPMPGKIFKVLKQVGDMVKQGEVILIMEAMKMEHPVKAMRDGRIKEISHGEGEQVAGGVELVVLEDE